MSSARACSDTLSQPGDVAQRRPTAALAAGALREDLGVRDQAAIAPAGAGSVRTLYAGGLLWRVRLAGPLARAQPAPVLLLLHGTGSDSSSWTSLLALLAQRFQILAPDLPGHGASGRLPRRRPGQRWRAQSVAQAAQSLPPQSPPQSVGPSAYQSGPEAYATALELLLQQLSLVPDIIVGHSAGAAIAARLGLGSLCRHAAIVSLNGALQPLAGWTKALFVPLAKLLVRNPLVPHWVSVLARADRQAVRRLLASTGSHADPAMIERYERLMADPQHLAGTLEMLAHWDLQAVTARLPELGSRLTLLAGTRDRTVLPAQALGVRACVPGSGFVTLPGLGHLAHEEAPQAVARLIAALACARGLHRRAHFLAGARP